MLRPSILVPLLAASIVAVTARAAEPPRVVASIGPLQSLVAAVMDGDSATNKLAAGVVVQLICVAAIFALMSIRP